MAVSNRAERNGMERSGTEQNGHGTTLRQRTIFFCKVISRYVGLLTFEEARCSAAMPDLSRYLSLKYLMDHTNRKDSGRWLSDRYRCAMTLTQQNP